MAAVDLKTGENVSWRIFALVVATVSGVGRRERSIPCLLGSKVRGQGSSYTCIEYLWIRSRSCANIPESLSTVPLLSSWHHELCCFCSGLWPGPAAIPAKRKADVSAEQQICIHLGESQQKTLAGRAAGMHFWGKMSSTLSKEFPLDYWICIAGWWKSCHSCVEAALGSLSVPTKWTFSIGAGITA